MLKNTILPNWIKWSKVQRRYIIKRRKNVET
jgi:hypothetical protein